MILLDNTIEEKLTRAYVALEMTRTVAKQGLGPDLTGPAALSLMNLLEVASQILEDVLDPDPSVQVRISSEEEELEMLM